MSGAYCDCANLIAIKTERCPSGLRSTLGKRVLGKLNRGFESHPLRHSVLIFLSIPFSLEETAILRTYRLLAARKHNGN
jgi:hypothetical protein